MLPQSPLGQMGEGSQENENELLFIFIPPCSVGGICRSLPLGAGNVNLHSIPKIENSPQAGAARGTSWEPRGAGPTLLMGEAPRVNSIFP